MPDDLITRACASLDPDVHHAPAIFREIVRELLEENRQLKLAGRVLKQDTERDHRVKRELLDENTRLAGLLYDQQETAT